jgi:hypothetical protein
MEPMVEKELLMHLKQLGVDEQRQVLDLARTLASGGRCGTPGASLLGFGGVIDAADLEIMAEVIQEGCEQVNPDEW